MRSIHAHVSAFAMRPHNKSFPPPRYLPIDWSLVVVVDVGGGGGKDDEVSSHKTGEKTAKNQQKSVGSLLRTSTE